MPDTDAYALPFQSIKEFLDNQNCSYVADEENHSLKLTLPFGDDQYEMSYWLTHTGDLMQFSIQFPDGRISAEDRLGVAEILVRANHMIDFGKLDMDMSTGIVRFHATHIIDEGYLGQGVLNRISFLGVLQVDMYQTAIRKHLMDGMSPEDVIALTRLDLEMTAEGHFLDEEELDS